MAFCPRALALVVLLLCAACVGPDNVHALVVTQRAAGVHGRVQVENVEGGRTLLTLELDHLPAPERFASDLTEFVAWLEDSHGARVNLGALRYDRARQGASLMATTQLRAFTVRVTGERHAYPDAPSNVLVASRNVTQ